MFTKQQITEALNRWNDDFIADPQKFQSTAQTVLKTLHQRMNGQPVTYGDEAFATLEHYIAQGNTDSIVDAINSMSDAVVKELSKPAKKKAVKQNTTKKAKSRKRR